MFDFMKGDTQIATGATLAAIAAVSGDSYNAKSGRGQCSIAAISAIGANLQRVRITSPDLPPTPGLDMWGLNTIGGAGKPWLNLGRIPLPDTAQVTVEATQDSGGNENEFIGILFHYPQGKVAAPSEVESKKKLVRRVAATANITASVKTSIGQITDLSTDKEYAICGAYGYSANLLGIEFDHPDFLGLRPGGPAATDVSQLNEIDFVKMGELPVFSARTLPYVVCYGRTANTPIVHIVLAEM